MYFKIHNYIYRDRKLLQFMDLTNLHFEIIILTYLTFKRKYQTS